MNTAFLDDELCPPGVAVIGSGYWGRNLVRNHYELGSLRLICDKDETLLARFQQEYPNVESIRQDDRPLVI